MSFDHELSVANHRITRWTFADAAARTAKTGLTSADKDKVAKQSDNNTYWIVTTVTAGVPTWKKLGGIELTDISATSPIFYNNSTGVISSQAANGSQNGYLTSTDWSTFNGKQATITLTTTGTSGAATFNGVTLNIPVYAGGASSESGSSKLLKYMNFK